jgi:putative colanic acid biosynthesis acetyltransferase WcaF
MEKLKISQISNSNRLARGGWSIVNALLFRPSPRPFFAWRRFLLKCFGAKIHRTALVYPTTRIWAPWNLDMAAHSCLGDYVDCYNVACVSLGIKATVSQYSFLCTASHDFESIEHSLVIAPIALRPFSWITADVFVAPGVIVGAGAVVLARSTVLKDVEAWKVSGGNPLRVLRDRKLSRGQLEEHFTVN